MPPGGIRICFPDAPQGEGDREQRGKRGGERDKETWIGDVSRVDVCRYKPFERPNRKFAPLRIPNSLQVAALGSWIMRFSLYF